MRKLAILGVFLFIIAIVVTAADEIVPVLTTKTPIEIPATAEAKAQLDAMKLGAIKVVGTACGDAMCYRLEGGITKKLINVPNKVTTRHYSRAITEQEKRNILWKAAAAEISAMLPKSKVAPVDIEEYEIKITAEK